MQNLPIPPSAVGRVGMVVAHRRVKDLDNSRLGIVLHPVGWVKHLFHWKQAVFAWQVLLTGDAVKIHGRSTHEVIVPDQCLQPISQLTQQELQTVIDLHERNETEAAVAQVRLHVDDMNSPVFEQTLHLAASQALLKRANEVVGVAKVLEEAGFWRLHGAESETWEWQTMHAGVEIQMTAGPGLFRDWQLNAYAKKDDSLHMPEYLALDEWPRGRILLILLEMWEDIFGRQHIPVQFALALSYRQHLRDLESIRWVLPHVEMMGDRFRMALRWLREAYAPDKWFVGPPRDMPLTVEVKDGIVCFQTEDHAIGVPLQRGWIDGMRLSLRSLMALPPNALRGDWVRLERTMTHANIGRHEIKMWTD